jgi:hypothetical protein
VAGELGADLVHRAVQVDVDDVGSVAARGQLGAGPLAQLLVGRLGQVARRVGLELLEEDALRGDLAEGLPVGRAGHGDGHGARRAVPGKPHDPDVVAEVLATELRADAELAGELEDLLLEVLVPQTVPGNGCGRRQLVQILRRGVLRGLQRELRARAADHDGQVVRGRRPCRASCE